MNNTTPGYIAIEQEIRDLVEHEICAHGKSDDIAIAVLRLEHIHWVEILFTVEDRFDLDLDDSILDFSAATPRAIAHAVCEHVAERSLSSDKCS
jgi:hypothetical protein